MAASIRRREREVAIHLFLAKRGLGRSERREWREKGKERTWCWGRRRGERVVGGGQGRRVLKKPRGEMGVVGWFLFAEAPTTTTQPLLPCQTNPVLWPRRIRIVCSLSLYKILSLKLSLFLFVSLSLSIYSFVSLFLSLIVYPHASFYALIAQSNALSPSRVSISMYWTPFRVLILQ